MRGASIEFSIDRDVDSAANDIRDRVSGIIDQLPSEADPPEIQKVDSNDDVIVWFNLSSERMTVPELSDYARRYLVDRFSVLDGVARVRVGGDQAWLNIKSATLGVERLEYDYPIPVADAECMLRDFCKGVVEGHRRPHRAPAAGALARPGQ